MLQDHTRNFVARITPYCHARYLGDDGHAFESEAGLPNFRDLAVFQIGWPYDFWVGGLFFFGRILKVVWPKTFSVGRF